LISFTICQAEYDVYDLRWPRKHLNVHDFVPVAGGGSTAARFSSAVEHKSKGSFTFLTPTNERSGRIASFTTCFRLSDKIKTYLDKRRKKNCRPSLKATRAFTFWHRISLHSSSSGAGSYDDDGED